SSQLQEPAELRFEPALYRLEISQIHDLLAFPREVHMKAQAQDLMISRQLDGGLGGGGVHHQAGAGHDSRLVGLNDPSIDPLGASEVVRVHDDISHRRPRHRSHSLSTLVRESVKPFSIPSRAFFVNADDFGSSVGIN